MTLLIPDEKCLVLPDEFFSCENAAGYYPGLVTPSTVEGAPLVGGLFGKLTEEGNFFYFRPKIFLY